MPVEITVRKARSEDAPALSRLNDLFNGAGSNMQENIRSSLKENGQELVLVALAGERAVGFACGQIFRSMCYSAYYGEITELFVEEAFRGQGIGRRLIFAMEEAFALEGVHAFQLFTGGANHSAQKFYEACGYRKTEEIMYRKRPSDA